MAENDKNWYVIHTYSGHEERVKKNLEQRIKFMDTGNEITQVVIPTEDEIEVRGGRRRTVTKKILPGFQKIVLAYTEDFLDSRNVLFLQKYELLV